MVEGFTHLNEDGDARMVDVGAKAVTLRTAIAEAVVTMAPRVKEALFAGALPKGDALAVVRVAAIMGAKRTPDLVPLCHPIGLDAVDVAVEEIEAGARIEVTTRVAARTGVEMEAMTAAAVAAVALYDMIKGLDRGAEIASVRLLEKSGGKSGDWRR
ncbi:MAG TPA: cyclic pyranopterin monophosphate synthase MoaC [Acidimicrobiia bacterium]|nr:cyclic pyranopterin monophosphate synthase MoaC [Acidimicrobiia bacterium]